jgi:hypothetical protein
MVEAGGERDVQRDVEPVESDLAVQLREKAEQAAARRERAHQERQTLFDSIAAPHRASAALSWSPTVPAEGGQCAGCGKKLPAWARAGHAVEAAQNGRPRCYDWALGL